MKCEVYKNVIPIKLNIGCGIDYREGYIGIDREKFNEHVDVICDLDKNKLPYKDNSVDECYIAHVLEHLERPELLIAEMRRVLKTGGLLHIVAPYAFHPNSKVPVHKNEWGINTKILFDGSYHEFGKWSKVEWDVNFANRTGLKQKLLKPLIKKWPSIYESHFASLFPVAEIQFKLIK
jgi:predicted SAM-dependent methyltransferase